MITDRKVFVKRQVMDRRLTAALDYLFLGAIIYIVTLQPHFMHGTINFYETGIYLPQINELFHGKALYKDIFVLRGPLEIFMPAFLMKLFGMHIGVLNAYFYYGTILTLLIYAIFARRIFSTRYFVYIFTLVLIARTFPWSCYNVWGGIRFGFGILALLLAVEYLNKNKSYWLFFAGLSSSLAFWTSIELGVFSFISIVTVLCLYGYCDKKNTGMMLKHMVVYIFGIFIATVPFIIYLFSTNAFLAYVNTMRVILTKMTRVFDPGFSFETPRNIKEFVLSFSPLNHCFKYTLPFFFYMLTSLYLIKTSLKNRALFFKSPIVGLFIYGLLFYISAFRDIEGPQYRMAMQPLLLIMFFYLEQIYKYFYKQVVTTGGVKKALALFFVLLIFLYPIGFSISKYCKRFFVFKDMRSLIFNKIHAPIPYADPTPTAIKTERAKGIIVPAAQAHEIDEVVEYLTLNTKDSEAVFTFPDLGTYNFLADRPCLGRFCSAEFSFIDQNWFREMMKELKIKSPKYVIRAKDFSRLEVFRPTLGKYLDEVNMYLNKNYEVIKSYRAVDILKAE